MAPSPQQQRQALKREEKLKDMQEQVQDGSLVIRKMTDEERARFPPATERPQRGRAPRRPI
jgi:hypothetical protein